MANAGIQTTLSAKKKLDELFFKEIKLLTKKKAILSLINAPGLWHLKGGGDGPS